MQRVAILRALNRKFKWLIMDEPFSHLDELNTSIAADLIINEAQSQNASIIITSLNSKDLMSGFELITI
jgi:putative ABC transport system ATP-binding protein